MTRALGVLAVVFAVRPVAAEAPVHHALDIRLDPASRALRGVDHVTLRAGAPASFTLSSGFTIERLEVDGAPVPTRASGGPVALELTTRPVHELVVEYHGALGTPPPGGEITQAVAGSDGSYLPAAGWYPTFEAPFTYAVTLDVPDPQRAVTPGRLARETTADGRYRATFVSDLAAAELPLFAGPYRIADRIHRGWRLRTYFHPAIADLSDTYLDHVQDYLDLYDGWIGAYPYAGFAVVSSPFPVGLGFPGITYLGTQVLRLPFIPDTSLGHEVLHSWWGSCVRPGADGNWAEGLTTFMADYTYLERRGAGPAREERLAWLREFAVLPPAEDRPLSSFQGRSHAASQATGYHKAAFVFVMLRDEIGADAFASAVRRFWQAHRFESAGWKDLEAAFSEAAKLPLARFFQQWVQRTGAPELTLGSVRADGGHLTLKLAQAAPPYDLAIPVTVETAETQIARTVRLDEVAREYAFDVSGTPRALAADPDLRLFRRLAPAEIAPIISGVAFDPGATTVVAAGSDAARAAAREVAAGVFGRAPAIVPAGEPLPARPALVVGTTAEVAALLEKLGVEGPPASLAAKGTTRAWAARRTDGAALVVVAGNDAAALRAAAGPLSHYGRESFVVFDGPRMVERGVWQPAASPLRVELAH
jgi:aminopeptidase N